MPVDTLKRFREGATRLRGAEMKNRQLLEELRNDAVAVMALASASEDAITSTKRMDQLLEELRTVSEELRTTVEAYIDGALQQADAAVNLWESTWALAISDSALDRAREAEVLRSVLEHTAETLQNALRAGRRLARMYNQPAARFDELESRVVEFPIWARECQARWEMLDLPAPALDSERIAKAQAAYAAGDHEDIGTLMSRVQAGGPWVKE